MKRLFLLFMACMISVLAVAQTEANVQPTGTTVPPMLGIRWAKGTTQDLALNDSASRSDMTYHGGKIMPTANVTAIFWGSSWANYTGDKISGMDSWYQGFSNSGYATASDEYRGSNGQVGHITSYAGHYIDNSKAGDGSDTEAVMAEVCKVITNPDPSGNGYYPVYVDLNRGSHPYCAYHSYATCHGTPVQFAFFFKLDGDSGCDPADTSGLHSQGLAALSNVSGQELSEARTDPDANAWYDSQGQENGDKCPWTFGASLVTFSNATQWKIQSVWSHNVYSNGIGYFDQNGCLSRSPQLAPVTLTPSSLNFGYQTVGEPSYPAPITLTNNQSVSLSITNINNHFPGEVFYQTNDCGTSLRPHSSCTITVVFTPKRKTHYTGYLYVTDNGPGSPQTATMTGTGD